MEVALLFALGLGLIAAGAGVTTLLATRLPMDVLVTAQEHGRFAGLGSNQEGDGVGRASPSRIVPAAGELAYA
ncbi:Oxalate:formate antiporter [Cupriavidus necator]|uniref:Oxalate:formate antiporter n=1 Tax=Cupriavidus necator (strain ATCC 17699 / DSM 428 / KCTC 22496 / NCIMB 10442 / H16 / Stanier 337) TaxID=381666 RepID=Q0K0I6_CUPNH|nr:MULTISPECIES: hypothetical protein [Cupriavidus]EON20617.1 hypothetical protein C265_06594 [Cupriavidus sp. GA3-3]KUE90944.1 oxalate:formate antiporter [Cupriavidus necator]QCC04319.1 hypothetical protein E6A55_27785 [Cupriavidus necator H16]QQB79008.1 hypothetical protein I6H87_27370 [Cupriavidus necator]WKA43229.1 hypothetical protein QWP09_27845 [Cupriavidus necator]